MSNLQINKEMQVGPFTSSSCTKTYLHTYSSDLLLNLRSHVRKTGRYAMWLIYRTLCTMLKTDFYDGATVFPTQRQTVLLSRPVRKGRSGMKSPHPQHPH